MASLPLVEPPQSQAELRHVLVSELSTDVVRLANVDEDSIDGVMPALCVRAKSADVVATVLALCARLGAVVVPRGGGSHLHLGMPPERVDVVLELDELDEVIEYRPDDLTLAVATGTRFRDVQRMLAESGQMLALDPLVDASSTVGGVVATNRSGPRRAGLGTARDHIIGMEVAGVDGSVTKSGGMVVKNVTGYDLSKAHIGALGTLGIITRVNLKTFPIPAVETTLAIPVPDPASAVRLVDAFADLPFTCSALDLVQQELLQDMNLNGSWGVLAIRVPGTEDGVKEKVVMVRGVIDIEAGGGLIELHGKAQKRFWRDADMLARLPLTDPVTTTCLMSGLSTQVASMLGSVKELGDDLGLGTVSSARALHGVVRVSVTSQSASLVSEFVTRLRTGIQKLGGSLIIESSTGEVKRAVGVWGMQSDSSALKAMTALRDSFDPGRIINRGRYVTS